MPILTPEERIGSTLAGRYSLTAVLGKGGMGVVYEGLHLGTQRPVAVKLLHPGERRRETIVERFLREARAAGNIEHENVVKVLDVGECEDGELYLVLERLRGEDLLSRLQKGELSLPEAAELFIPVMDGIAEAHRSGIVHRDLKPANIFLHTGRKGRVIPKLLDFGIAKLLAPGEDRLTHEGAVIGTPWYMSPEQMAGAGDLGPSTDVWSIAVVFYESVTGQLPYEVDSPQGMISKLLTEEPRPLSQVMPEAPPSICAWIDRALRREPGERPRMQELADGLEEAFEELGMGGPGISDRSLSDLSLSVEGSLDLAALIAEERASELPPARSLAEAPTVEGEAPPVHPPSAELSAPTTAPTEVPALSRRWLPVAIGAAIALLGLGALGMALLRPWAGDPGEEPVMAPLESPPPSRLGVVPEGFGRPVGSRAPGARVRDMEGHPVQLVDLYEEGTVMLFFYRGGWCPFCNRQVHDVTEAYPGFRARGITPVFLSAELPDQAAHLSAAYEVPFPILSDPDLAALRAFRVTYRVEGEELRELRRFGIDLERTSGRDHHTIAVPSIFLIWHGVIRWAHSDPDFTVRPSPEQLFEVLDELGLEPRPEPREGAAAEPE